MQKIYFVPIFTKPIIATPRIKYLITKYSNWENLGWLFKPNNMKTLTFIYELLKFILFSVPLGISIYLTANLYFEIKRLINDRNRQQH